MVGRKGLDPIWHAYPKRMNFTRFSAETTDKKKQITRRGSHRGVLLVCTRVYLHVGLSFCPCNNLVACHEVENRRLDDGSLQGEITRSPPRGESLDEAFARRKISPTRRVQFEHVR